jgi:hypothetical protein
MKFREKPASLIRRHELLECDDPRAGLAGTTAYGLEGDLP